MQKVKNAGMEHLDGIDSNDTTDIASTLSTLGFTIVKSSTATGQQDQQADFTLIYFETNAVRVGAATPTAAKGLIFEAGEFLVLESAREITDTMFISAVAGAHATLNAQIGYTR